MTNIIIITVYLIIGVSIGFITLKDREPGDREIYYLIVVMISALMWPILVVISMVINIIIENKSMKA